jgi:peptide/nickel transport system permease protein
MMRLLFSKAANAILVVMTVAVLNFSLVRLAPGDPALILAGQAGAADEKFVDQLRVEFGLDKPLYVQLVDYLSRMARFDLGFSYRQNKSVLALVAERIPNTLLLTGTAFMLALIGGVSLGSAAAWRRGTITDTLIGGVALVFYATPVFFNGLLLLFVFSAKLEWLPGFGSETVGGEFSWVGAIGDRLSHLVLPAITLSLLYAATYVRLTRASAIEVLGSDFVKTARAKGLPDRRIRRAHVLRNAVLPVLTIAGMQAGQLIGGAVVVETIFGWPGVGRLAFDALLQRDYPVLLGVFFICSIMVVLFNLLTEIGYRWLDPRVGARS